MTIKSSYCYLYFWLTSYKLEIPRIPSLNANNMLEWFTKFRKTDSLLFIRVVSLAVPGLSCSMWDLVPWPGIKPRPHALGIRSWPWDHQGSPSFSSIVCVFKFPLRIPLWSIDYLHKSVLLKFQVFEDFPVNFLLLISSLFLLWSKNIFLLISVLFSLFRFVLSSKIYSILFCVA